MALQECPDRRAERALAGLRDRRAKLGQRIGQTHAVGRRLVQHLVEGAHARIDRRAHAGRREARPFLVVPDGQHQRRAGRDAGIVDRLHRFQRGQDALHAVESPRHGLAVGVRAGGDWR